MSPSAADVDHALRIVGVDVFLTETVGLGVFPSASAGTFALGESIVGLGDLTPAATAGTTLVSALPAGGDGAPDVAAGLYALSDAGAGLDDVT